MAESTQGYRTVGKADQVPDAYVRPYYLEDKKHRVSVARVGEKLYAFDAEVESNTIEVHVSRLRKKLGTGVIETERGLGYRLGAP